MSSIFDLLTLKPLYSPYFVVNTAASYVLIQPPSLGAGIYPVFSNSGGVTVLAAGDNINIISAGYVLPESFVMASGAPDPSEFKVPRIILGVKDAGSSSILYIPELGGLGGISLPMENFESGIGLFVNIASIFSGKYQLYGKLHQDDTYLPRVSMQGVPASLDATTQLVTVFLKITHNSAMAAT
jgi:hypothetical protein